MLESLVFITIIILYIIYQNRNLEVERCEREKKEKIQRMIEELDSIPDPFMKNKPYDSNQSGSLNMYISAEDKKKYLGSLKWKTKRQKVFKRDNHQCKVCDSKNDLQCHHVRYDNLEREPLEDLVTLCQDCHNDIHDKLGYDRETIYNIKELK